MSRDTIYWKIENAGPNALGCASYELDSGRSNIKHGWCKDLNDFTSMKDVPVEKRKWIESNGTWTLTSKLSGHQYYAQGRYVMYWYNPSTTKQERFEYILTP